MHEASSRYSENASSTSSRFFDKLRPWKSSVAGRRKAALGTTRKDELVSASDPYTELAVASSSKRVEMDGSGTSTPGSVSGSGSASTHGSGSRGVHRDVRVEASRSPISGIEAEPSRSAVQPNGVEGIPTSRLEEEEVENGYEWEVDSDVGSDVQPDTFSWIDPSIIGTEGFHQSSSMHHTTPPESSPPIIPPEPPEDSRPKLRPLDSYNLLLAYQSASFNHTPHPTGSTIRSPYTSSSGSHLRNHHDNPEWYEMVDRSVRDSLDKEEVRRQGLWWELINGEREYVRDLKIICVDFVIPLREHRPPIIEPDVKLNAFIREVFSTMQELYQSHAALLERLMGRQRQEWPLLSSAADVLLDTFLDNAVLYEKYMKNFPFAESRIKREQTNNPRFMAFLDERNTAELTQRRNISTLLVRPTSRLTRIMLQLKSLLQCTPIDHPDHEQIPAVMDTLQRVLRGSQPGIASAEARVKCWNIAERLLFRRGELHEMLNASWYTWDTSSGASAAKQIGMGDLEAILLDNYLLLARGEDNGKLVVVSRPIHIDFLSLVSVDGLPERRYDFLPRRRLNGGVQPPRDRPVRKSVPPPESRSERMMYPFTITAGMGKTYTLCTGTEAARGQWRDKIEGARTLRKFDLESNSLFAIHTISLSGAIQNPLPVADTFTWCNRETVAVATAKSIWVGWRHDTRSFRELVRINTGPISAIIAMPDFGWLLAVYSGSLVAFNLHQMMPTSEPATWMMQGPGLGIRISASEHVVAFAKVGTTKDRLMVVYVAHLRDSHKTILSFHEPLVEHVDSKPFRHFANTTIPGYASELSFFRQTVAVATEKAFVVTEAGNPDVNLFPTGPRARIGSNDVGTTTTRFVEDMVLDGKPMAMYQVAENELLLVYDIGACFVTTHGEIARRGAFIRWNLRPSYTIYHHPYILIYNHQGGQVEVRDLEGKMCELIREPGLKPVHKGIMMAQNPGSGLVTGSVGECAEILGMCQKGLVQIKEMCR